MRSYIAPVWSFALTHRYKRSTTTRVVGDMHHDEGGVSGNKAEGVYPIIHVGSPRDLVGGAHHLDFSIQRSKSIE